jgi:LmbE family N-acetylglucosaminyl deacetylase
MSIAHIYLSPHLDDAVLSCGGTIQGQVRRAERVLVITVFAGRPDYRCLSPFAASLHASWGDPPDPMRARRAEDAAVMQALGASYRHLDNLDCIYRTANGEFLYTSEEALFGDVHPAEANMEAQLAPHLAMLCAEHPGATVNAPLGVGHHVDHQVVRGAALALEGIELLFYEDYPYVEETGALERALAELGDVSWVGEVREINVEAKIQAVAAYRSQLEILFSGQEEMARRVRAYASSITQGQGYGERFWRFSP